MFVGQNVSVTEVPTTRYVNGADGAQVAYQVIGDRSPDLVYLTGTISHVDMRWENPSSARFLEGLASFSRVISFDMPGVGASDRLSTGEVPTWQEWAEDLTVVLDAAHSEQAALFAVGDGAGKMAITFAATQPGRVPRAHLFNALRGAPDAEAADFAADFTDQFWAPRSSCPSSAPASCMIPRHRAWWAKYMRETSTPKAMAARMRLEHAINMDFVLPSLRVPTLVMHRTDLYTQAMESARSLTERIPTGSSSRSPVPTRHRQTEHATLILNAVCRSS